MMKQSGNFFLLKTCFMGKAYAPFGFNLNEKKRQNCVCEENVLGSLRIIEYHKSN